MPHVSLQQQQLESQVILCEFIQDYLFTRFIQEIIQVILCELSIWVSIYRAIDLANYMYEKLRRLSELSFMSRRI